MIRRCKAVVVGTGSRGLLHLRALSDYEQGVLHPIIAYDWSEASRSRAKAVPGVTVLDSPEAIFTYAVDEIAVIATPPSSHVRDATSLINVAPTLLIEKPAARSSVEFQDLQAVAARASTQVYIGYSERYNPAVRAMRASITRLVRARDATGLRFVRRRPSTGLEAKDERQELAVHDVDFVVNALFPDERLRFERITGTDRLCLRSLTATGIALEIVSDLYAPAAVTEYQATLVSGELRRHLMPIPTDKSRMAALRVQLDHILPKGRAPSMDLVYERRVVESLNGC